jgi:hypothetical protein
MLVQFTKGMVVPAVFVAGYFISPLVDGEPVRAEMGPWYGFFRYGFPLEGLAYFSLGMALRRWPVTPGRAMRTWGAGILGAAGLAISVYRTALVHGGVQPSVHWSVLAVPCYLFAILCAMPARPFPRILVANAFAIFIVHYFPNFVYSRCVGKAAKHWHTMLANFVFVVSMSIFICEVLRRKCPRFAKMLFGGR